MIKNKDQYRKIFARISTKMNRGVFGLTSTKGESSKVSYRLAQTMGEIKKVLLVDLDNDVNTDPDFAYINSLLRAEETFRKDGRIYRLNFTKSDDVDILVESANFSRLIENARKKFDYIIINEKNMDSSQAYLTRSIEDGKILVVREGETTKRDLKIKLGEIKDLGFNFLGVIYHR